MKGSLDLIPSSSVKIQIMSGKVCLRCKDKTLLGIVNKLLKTKSQLIIHHPAMFSLIPEVKFPANSLNFRWRWWDEIQAIFLNLFYFNKNILIPSSRITSSANNKKKSWNVSKNQAQFLIGRQSNFGSFLRTDIATKFSKSNIFFLYKNIFKIYYTITVSMNENFFLGTSFESSHRVMRRM